MPKLYVALVSVEVSSDSTVHKYYRTLDPRDADNWVVVMRGRYIKRFKVTQARILEGYERAAVMLLNGWSEPSDVKSSIDACAAAGKVRPPAAHRGPRQGQVGDRLEGGRTNQRERDQRLE